MRVDDILESILVSGELVRPSDLVGRSSNAPAEPGIYAFYLDDVPRPVRAEAAEQRGDLALLYLGIAPSRAGSRSTLRKRLRNHLRGNASASTLRLSLGCLLQERLGIELRRRHRSGRMTFGEGETLLTEWIGAHARVTWVVEPRPWQIERELIARLFLPLNLDHNSAHPFHEALTQLRRSSKQRARGLPTVV